jgi:hypothetical protein
MVCGANAAEQVIASNAKALDCEILVRKRAG